MLKQEYRHKYDENNKIIKEIYLQLKPDLASPYYAKELEQILEKEEKRHNSHYDTINNYQIKFIENEEKFANDYYFRSIINFQAFILIFDSVIINEDIVKLDGKI